LIERKTTSVSLKLLLVLSLSSTVLFVGIERLKLFGKKEYIEWRKQASARTKMAFDTIKKARLEKGIPLEKEDINATGIIGPEFSPLVTTLGLLSAKRTAANPNFAGLIASMLLKSGAREGDMVALGLSGSFPSLNIACLVASDVLKLKPVVISSVGSSTWGATHPEMTWLDMEAVLHRKGLISTRSIAVSLTGGAGQNFLLPEGRDLARAVVERNHLALIDEPDLSSHIRKRLVLYDQHSEGKPIRVFVNVGGPLVDLGEEEGRRQIPNGLLLHPLRNVEVREEGIISTMLRRGIPVIHLLNINGLAKRNGLPVDPVPLPLPE
jgi:poly-gamma-glutamate system protein